MSSACPLARTRPACPCHGALHGHQLWQSDSPLPLIRGFRGGSCRRCMRLLLPSRPLHIAAAGASARHAGFCWGVVWRAASAAAGVDAAKTGVQASLPGCPDVVLLGHGAELHRLGTVVWGHGGLGAQRLGGTVALYSKDAASSWASRQWHAWARLGAQLLPA